MLSASSSFRVGDRARTVDGQAGTVFIVMTSNVPGVDRIDVVLDGTIAPRTIPWRWLEKIEVIEAGEREERCA